MKKILILLAAILSQPALAQSFTSAPETGTYVPRAATYKTDGTLNVLGDGSDAKGGIAPAFSTHPEPADPNPTLIPGYVIADNAGQYDLTVPGTATAEKKARFEADSVKTLFDDPIRFWGQPGKSHCHEFFGNTNANAFSTHISARIKGDARASGGISGNSTIYWQPCLQKIIGTVGALGSVTSGSTTLTITTAPATGTVQVGQNVSGPGIALAAKITALGTGGGGTGTYIMSAPATSSASGVGIVAGKPYAIPASHNVIYYSVEVGSQADMADDLQRLHVLFRFVGGRNMDDPNDCAVKREIDIANGGTGTGCSVTPGRYSYWDPFDGSATGNYYCNLADGSQVPTQDGTGHSKAFRTGPANLDSSDPWYTGGVHRCGDGATITTDLHAPDCWDGWNVTSPGGYKHVRYAINDSLTGKRVCPNSWYKVPVYQNKRQNSTHGWPDYSTWSLDSDAPMEAKLAALGTPRTVLPGESLHDDWMHGWNHQIATIWQCNGLGIGAGCQPHIMGYSQIGPNQRLLTYGPTPDGKFSTLVGSRSAGVDTNDVSKLWFVGTDRPTSHMGH